ncbi:Hypothetical protein PBC10988_31870 [Planctomycetales bacterium 10988]|nr:Hypothetical protein PBC10988_31870 [Planctomycetales bacterium 10988]
MAWLSFFSHRNERHRQALLKQQKETPLQLESLESRHLLDSTPFLIDLNPIAEFDINLTLFTGENNTAFFRFNDGSTGAELWRSDGTELGTQLVKDLFPGPLSSGPSNLTHVNGTQFFSASDGSTGSELWMTDGTSIGTALVKDIHPNMYTGYFSDIPRGSRPEQLTNVNGTLFFTANNGTSGTELWMSDGTEAGTQLVRDIKSGSDSSGPDNLTNVNGTLCFTANDGSSGTEVWMSDGTEAGTQLVRDIKSGSDSSGPDNLTNVNGTLYFTANDGSSGTEVWMSDGTEAGTQLVRDIKSGSDSSGPDNLTNVNGTLYFTANDGSSGTEVWMSDGTEAGTQLVRDNKSGSDSSGPDNLTNVNGTLYFTANDGSSGTEVWMSDGTEVGTQIVRDIHQGGISSFPSYLTNVDGILFFRAIDGVAGPEIWMSDGTEVGTRLVKDIRKGALGSAAIFLTNVNGTLFFRANNGITGYELWKSDGTETGTQLVKDLQPRTKNSGSEEFTDVNGTMYFSASDGISGKELWKSNGTKAGTQLIKDINIDGSSSPRFLTNVNGTLFFVAVDGSMGRELWMSDGTEAGTQLVKDIRAGKDSSFPRFLINVNGTLFFEANNGSTGPELWISDGTEAGTQLVKDIRAGRDSSSPIFFTNVNGTLFFTANEGGYGAELWMSDGTSEGTQLVKDLLPGPHGSAPTSLINVNGTLFFEGRDRFTVNELWKSDGTETGTQLVKDIRPGEGQSTPQARAVVNGTLFFTANDGSTGTEFWKSDGTSEGTQLIKDIQVGIGSSFSFTTNNSSSNVNGTFFFTANDGITGTEVWMSDGTSGGTHLVKDIKPGSDSSGSGRFTNVNGTLFFTANDGSLGTELWMSDGTSEGTQLVKDIQVGSNGSTPSFLTNVDGTLFFTANDGVHGSEFWVLEFDPPTLNITPTNVLTNDNAISFTFNFSEAIFEFVEGDIEIIGGMGSNFTMVDSNTYTIDVTPFSDGAITVSVADELAEDASTNLLIGDSATIEYDGTPPSLEISPDSRATNEEVLLFTFEFSEDVTGFATDDVVVANGAKGLFSMTDGNTYTLTVMPSSEGDLTVSVAFAVAQDAAGNTSIGDSATITHDTTPPTLEITPDGIVTNQGSTIFTFQFSEEVTGFTIGDISVTNGFKGDFTAVDGDTYELEVFSPCSSGDLIVTVADDAAFDGASNGNLGDSAKITYDNIAPTLEITPDGTSTNASSTIFTFQFSEAVTGFTIDDLVLMSIGPNISSGTFTAVDEDTYTLEVFHSNGNGDVIVSVGDDAAFDEATNGNTGDSATVTYDTIGPTLEITPDGTITNQGSTIFTFQFSEGVTDFTADDMTFGGDVNTNGFVSKGTFTAVDEDTYTLEVFYSNANGELIVTVADDAAFDEATNGNTGDSATIEYDSVAPTVGVSPDNQLTNVATTVFTFQFSEEVFDFTADDVMVTNGTKGTFTAVDGDTYTLEVTAMADGDVIVNALADGAMDTAGNGNQIESATVTYDGTAPTLIITPDSGITNDDPITFTFEFSEEIFEFVEGDIEITGGTGGNFTMVDGDTYTIDVTPDADGEITVTVADEGAEDEAGNLLVGDLATIEYDGTAPTLEITPDSGESNDDPILFTFLFSEDVTGFDANDIMVMGGTAGTFTTIDGSTCTLEVTPDEEDGDVTVTVADGVAQDAAMNDNVGDSATVTFNATEPTPLIVTGTDAGGPATVRVFDSSGNELLSFMPYGAFTGGVRVATGDINGDGILDIITAAGPGGGPHVQVFDSRTGEHITGGLNNIYAYAPNVTTGVFVASGDVNGDGFDDIITAPDAGGGPHLKVYNGLTGDVITEFYAYAPNVTVGVRIATGDINGDGFAEIITTPGPGGGPHVRVINGMTGEQMPGPVTNFYAYAPNVLTGLYVASGDVNGDGFDDIITSPGAGGGPHVQAFSSADGSTLQNFYAYHPNFLGGVRVGSADLNQDGFADIITVPGSSGGPHTRAFSGVDLSDLSNFFSGPPTNTDGLFIAGGISYIPIEDPAPTSAPFTSPMIAANSETPQDITLDALAKKKSWQDDADEFFQSAEEIDKLFSGLGIE